MLQTTLEVRVPVKGTYHVALNNLPGAKAEESTDNGRRVYRWQLGPLAAAESLPGDPPASQWVATVAVSSLPSWDEFAVWFRRIAQGSDLIDDTVRKTATELGNGAKDRTDRIRRSFEFVSALRYVAIECGVHGFRPRTPAQVLSNRYGDCKDKANLLVALLRCQNIPSEFRLAQPWVGDGREFSKLAIQPRHLLRAAGAGRRAAGRFVAGFHGQRDAVRLRAAGGLWARGAWSSARTRRISKRSPTANRVVSEVRDTWELTQDEKGGWQGNFHRAATGLADDGLRRAFRGLTPVQRGARLYGMLTGLWPSADFTQGAVSDVSTLHDGVELRAEVTAASGDLPRVQPSGMETLRRAHTGPALVAQRRSTHDALADGATALRGPRTRCRRHLPPSKQTEVGGQKDERRRGSAWTTAPCGAWRGSNCFNPSCPPPTTPRCARPSAVGAWRFHASTLLPPRPMTTAASPSPDHPCGRPRPTWNCCAASRRVTNSSPPNSASASSARMRSSAICSSPSPCRDTS